MNAVKLLAFDTSTDALSVAVSAGGPPIAHQGLGGAHASAGLIPAIQALLAHAGLLLTELDAIAFARGPGSFTGLRTACSVAQGLSFGSGVPLLPVDTLMAVAEQARAAGAATRVVAVLDARMDEVYFGAYEFEGGLWQTREPPRLGRPEDVVVPDGWLLAGNALQAYGRRLAKQAQRLEAAPNARCLLRLAPALIAAGQTVAAADALPVYIRDKVAQTTEERSAARLAKAGGAPETK